MKLGKGNLSGKQKLFLALLFLAPLLVMVAKWSALPTSGFFTSAFSLTYLSQQAQRRVMYVLSVPFGAVLVVFFRVVLGIRLLGLFRVTLIAVAFQMTGIVPGLVFLTAVIATVVITRPLIKAMHLPHVARMSVMLNTVAITMLVAFLASHWFGFEYMDRMVYFPVVALCMLGDGFSNVLIKEGTASALWRGAMTALVAVVTAFSFEIQGFRWVFLCFPELLVAEIGCVVVIGEFLDLRLLTRLNPRAARTGSSACARAGADLSDA